MHYHAIKKNGVAGDAQLNGTKEAVAAADLDPAMILASIHLGVTQEIPKLAVGEQTGGQGEGEERSKAWTEKSFLKHRVWFYYY